MSEPSLRTTAIERACAAHPARGTAWQEGATAGVDATLGVIHTQRSAIAQALDDRWPALDRSHAIDGATTRDVADAVLATLGAAEASGTVQPTTEEE